MHRGILREDVLGGECPGMNPDLSNVTAHVVPDRAKLRIMVITCVRLENGLGQMQIHFFLTYLWHLVHAKPTFCEMTNDDHVD